MAATGSRAAGVGGEVGAQPVERCLVQRVQRGRVVAALGGGHRARVGQVKALPMSDRAVGGADGRGWRGRPWVARKGREWRGRAPGALTWKTAKVSVPTLLITGTTGVGKPTVAAEINDVLAALKVPNAAVDLDALVWQWPSTSGWNN